MNPMDQLKDIHIPAQVGMWPLAYGWWLLIVLMLVTLTAGIYLLVRRYKRRAAVRSAMLQLAQIDLSAPTWPVEVNSLLKRLTMSYLPQQDIASLYGDKWVESLMQLYVGKQTDDIRQSLMTLQQILYVEELPAVDAVSLTANVNSWMAGALPPASSHKQEHSHV